MILSPKKNGAGYISSYTINIGNKEAKMVDFINKDGDSKELEKIIDTENKQIIIKLKK